MVTVKDLKVRLEEYDENTPIFWGVDFLPCWVAKKDSTIDDFPMKEAFRPVFIKNDEEFEQIESYLYFGDYRDWDKLNSEYQDYRQYHKEKSLWEHIKFWWNSR